MISALFVNKIKKANDIGMNAVITTEELTTEQLKQNALKAIQDLKESKKSCSVQSDGSIKVSDHIYIIPNHQTPLST